MCYVDDVERIYVGKYIWKNAYEKIRQKYIYTLGVGGVEAEAYGLPPLGVGAQMGLVDLLKSQLTIHFTARGANGSGRLSACHLKTHFTTVVLCARDYRAAF